MSTPGADDLAVGTVVDVEAQKVAHGGHVVGRHEGRVIFIRHALPGELVRVRITDGGPGDSFLRGDAVEVLRASEHRVAPPCRFAHPGGCGGCDFQHVTPAHQRALKAAVVTEQFARLARLEVTPVVEELPVGPGGPGWRTRVEFAVDDAGRPGLRAHRSHDVVPVDRCLIAVDAVNDSGVLERAWPGERAVDVIAPSGGAGAGEAVLVPVPTGEKGAPPLRERVVVGDWEETFEVAARGFWQVHPAAAATFVGHVLAELDPQPGERAVDLYSGVGLFAAALADRVGADGAVLAIEGDRSATEAARRNLAGRPQVEVRRGRVDAALRPLVRQGVTADVVVLDPPRSGAGKAVVDAVVALTPRAVVYVACDPAALARDTARFLHNGWTLRTLRVLDAFPMTHHMECLATFDPPTA